MNNIPNDYTECEVYNGYTIALRGERYYAFDNYGDRIKFGGCETREKCRRKIDNNLYPINEI